jgi:uncharacterized phiE125 gp8 family phage protein
MGGYSISGPLRTADKSITQSATTVEPLQLSEAKKHLEIADADTAHDEHLQNLIQQAREQVEHDCQVCLISRTVTEKFNWSGDEEYWQLYFRPVTAVASITYYDTTNTQQTFSASLYSLDADRRRIWLNSNAAWPTTYDRWDAISVAYTAGYGANGGAVPQMFKQAMLLLIGYYFEERTMMGNEIITGSFKAYENLLARMKRSNYP